MSNPLGTYQLPDDKSPRPSLEQPREVKAQLPIEQEIAASLEQNIQFFWRSVLRGKYVILAASLTVGLVVFIWCRLQTPIYRAEVKVLIETPTGEAEEIVGFSQRRAVLETDMMTEKDVIQSRSVAEKVVENLKLREVAPFKGTSDPIGAVLSLIKVDASPRSRVLKVSILYEDPVLAARLANEVFNAYVQASEETSRTWIVRTVDQMRNEVIRLRKQLDTDQQKVKQYEAEYPQIASRQAIEEQLKQLNSELATVSAIRLNLRTELEELAAFQKQGADVRDHPKVAKDPSVEQTLGVIQSKEVELTQLLNTYGEKFPLVVEKRAELETLRKILSERKLEIVEDLKSKYVQLAARERELRKSMTARSEELRALLVEIGGYESLLGEVEVSKNLYSLVLERMNKAGIIGRAEQSKVKLLSHAEVPRSPYAPQTERNVSVTFVTSLGAMAYLIYLYFLMLKPIESQEEVSQVVRASVLTEVPLMKQNKSGETELLADQTEGFGKDALHFLRSALAATGQRMFVFTSANPSEGKTFVVHNLGIYLAREGRRVLVCGTDLRDLRLKGRLGVEVDRTASLESYLMGQCDAKALVIPTKVERLFYLGSERVMKNALDVVASPQFQRLIQQLASEFDYILLDSPPVKLFPDSVVIAQSVKNVIFVVRHAKTPSRDLSKGVNQILKQGAHITGVVINGKTLGWRNYYYYNYYYGKSGRTGLVPKMISQVKYFSSFLSELIEKRKHVHLSASLPIEGVYAVPSGEDRKFWALVTNLSEGGLLAEFWPKDQEPEFKDWRGLPEVQELDFKIKISDQEHISAKGIVTMAVSHRGQVRMGVKFTQISPQDSKRIQRFLNPKAA